MVQKPRLLRDRMDPDWEQPRPQRRLSFKRASRVLLAVAMLAASLAIVPAAASAQNNAAQVGQWSSVIEWEFNSRHAYVNADGHIVTWKGGDPRSTKPNVNDFVVWDPETNRRTVIKNNLGANLFCSFSLSDAVGQRGLMLGGKSTNTRQNSFTTQLSNGRATDFEEMNEERWYPSANTLADGRILVHGGTPVTGKKVDRYNQPKTAEIYEEGQGWTNLSGTFDNDLWDGDKKRWFYPRTHVTPNGDVWAMAWDQMYSIDPDGNGDLTRLGTFRGGNFGSTSMSVQYDSGKILQVGGGLNDSSGKTPGSADASIVDLNFSPPRITSTGAMNFGRHWGDGLVLPDGTVIAIGGSGKNNSLQDVRYAPELWDPATGQWTVLAANATPRLYHSVAALMNDGAIFTAGGGDPGPVSNADAEIFYPPYLFKNNGSRATQMTISQAPESLRHGQSFTFRASGSVDRVTMIKVNHSTHSMNSQVFQELSFSTRQGQITASAPSNANVATPGLYQLFALDSAGVPSEAAMVWMEPQSGPGGPTDPTQPGPSGELIADGSFEDASVGNGKAVTRTIEAWDSTHPKSKLRIWDGPRSGFSASEGDQFTELNHLRGTMITQTLAVQPGAKYQFTLQAQSSGSQPGQLRVTVDGATVSQKAASSNGWRIMRGSFTAQSSTVEFGLSTAGGKRGDFLLVDDVSVRRK